MTNKYAIIMRIGVLSILLLGMYLLFGSHKQSLRGKSLTEVESNDIVESLMKIKSEKQALDSAQKIKTWLQKNGYSTSLLFLADMKLSMEVKRFYVINLDSNKILQSFLVAHGSGKGSTADSVVCSNAPGSLCTSLGKFKLGDTLIGEYGKGYWMDGLEKTNNNARKRLIVFHYYLLQTTQEHAEHNYFSFGCPMIAKSSFEYCDNLIKKEVKPVMMWIYK